MIQSTGGTRSTIQAEADWIRQTLAQMAELPRARMGVDELIIGPACLPGAA